MDTTTDTTPVSNSVPDGECGPDCVLIDRACRCYHGESAATEPEWLRRLEPTF